MTDKVTIQLEKYYQKLLSQEGLGIYRANPWERNRPFNPEELERLVLPEKLPRYDLIFLWRSTEREREVIFCLFYDQFSNENLPKKLISPERSKNLPRPSFRKLRKKD